MAMTFSSTLCGPRRSLQQVSMASQLGAAERNDTSFHI